MKDNKDQGFSIIVEWMLFKSHKSMVKAALESISFLFFVTERHDKTLHLALLWVFPEYIILRQKCQHWRNVTWHWCGFNNYFWLYFGGEILYHDWHLWMFTHFLFFCKTDLDQLYFFPNIDMHHICVPVTCKSFNSFDTSCTFIAL